MKVAVIGSRVLEVHNIEQYLPFNTTEIISGCARGTKFVIESCKRRNIPLKLFLVRK